MHGGFHPKSNVQWQYTSRKEGGRGLVSVTATILDETHNIQEHILKMAPKDKLLGECLRQQQTVTDYPPEKMPWLNKALHGICEVATSENSTSSWKKLD